MSRSKKLGLTLIEVIVVMVVVVLIVAITLSVYAQSKGAAKTTASISNMRQLGQAAAIYSETYGSWPNSCRYLVEANLVPTALVSNSNDSSGQGLGNIAVTGNYYGVRSPGLTKYKLSYGSFLEWEISRPMKELIMEADGGGWLIDLSNSKKPTDPRDLLFSEGIYHRSLFDTAIVTRRHYTANVGGQLGRTPKMLFADNGEKLKK
ncbi:MAG: prepilin-type N-terminal cleavage/methylation domain-containing protein [Fimbriimonadaceae bacterium]